MNRKVNPNRIKAFEIFKENYGKITTKKIAALLNESYKNVEYWRAADKWKEKYNPKGGAPIGNKNAVGHKGVAPERNQNSRKHGFFSKYFPKEVINIMELTEGMEPLDILWSNIKLKYAAIVRSQKIMYVKNQNDKTKELKKIKSQSANIGSKEEPEIVEVYREEEYDIQYAWDKQANFLRAQSTAMGQLTRMIKQYDEMLHQNWETATEEQKLRVEKLKVSIDATRQDIKNRIETTKEKLKLEKERFEHQKKIDEGKMW